MPSVLQPKSSPAMLTPAYFTLPVLEGGLELPELDEVFDVVVEEDLVVVVEVLVVLEEPPPLPPGRHCE